MNYTFMTNNDFLPDTIKDYPNIFALSQKLDNFIFNNNLKYIRKAQLEGFENSLNHIDFNDISMDKRILTFHIDDDYYISGDGLNSMISKYQLSLFFEAKGLPRDKRNLVFKITNCYNFNNEDDLIKAVSKLNDDYVPQITEALDWCERNNGHKYKYDHGIHPSYYGGGRVKYDFYFSGDHSMSVTFSLEDVEFLKEDLIFYEILKEAIIKLNTITELKTRQ